MRRNNARTTRWIPAGPGPFRNTAPAGGLEALRVCMALRRRRANDNRAPFLYSLRKVAVPTVTLLLIAALVAGLLAGQV
ncbi:MAG: hypothetical protein M3O22_03640 [Pseudomonadota bacterium]|nr:hypothetical protein [Pseudomonadota bacterium]